VTVNNPTDTVTATAETRRILIARRDAQRVSSRRVRDSQDFRRARFASSANHSSSLPSHANVATRVRPRGARPGFHSGQRAAVCRDATGSRIRIELPDPRSVPGVISHAPRSRSSARSSVPERPPRSILVVVLVVVVVVVVVA